MVRRVMTRDVCDQVYDVFRAALLVSVLVILLLLTGCAAVTPELVKRNAAKGAAKYCETFTYEVRSTILRPEFNTLVAPHEVYLHCYGDPENPRPDSTTPTVDADGK